MKVRQHLPLLIFTLIIPGIVFSYGIHYVADVYFLLWHLLVGGICMGVASLHLRQPTATPCAMRNVCTSWFSREAVAFSVFFCGVLIQIIFPDLRGFIWRFLITGFGIFGVISTINVYTHTHVRRNLLLRGWPITLDFICEGIFVSTLCLIHLYRQGFVYDLSINIVVAMLNIGSIIKLIREFGLNLLQFIFTRKIYWLFMWFLSIGLIGIVYFKLDIQIIVFMVISTVLSRYKLLVYIEQESLREHATQLRETYMPKEYQQYF